MPISALNLNDNAMCELGVMFYCETMSALFAHQHDSGFVMRDRPATSWKQRIDRMRVDSSCRTERQSAHRRPAMREIFLSTASTIDRRSMTSG